MSAPPAPASRASWPAGRALTRRQRRLAAVGLLLVSVAVGSIVLTPGAPAPGAQSSLEVSLDSAHASGLVPEVISYHGIEWLANVVMFVPVGFLLATVLPPPRRWWAAIICAVASAAIELMQKYWIADRVGSVKDFIANTAGGVAGLVLLLLLIRLVRSGASEQAEGAWPKPGSASEAS